MNERRKGRYPAGETESLGQSVYEEDVVFIDVDNVFGGRDGGAVTIAGVIVAAVEFVHDESVGSDWLKWVWWE